MDRILVIDDDVELCSLVQEYLQAEGFSVECVHDGERGLQRATAGAYLLAVLDVMLPGINGFEVLRRIRATSRLPVLLLTARGEDVDRIVGLEIGADDYLPKPFNPRELEVLLREAGHVVPRERLVNAVLSRKFSPFDRSIDMHVSKVRKKLGDTDDDNDEHIKTVRGVGYIFARPREKVRSST
jgi:two-component system response regulator CpxR